MIAIKKEDEKWMKLLRRKVGYEEYYPGVGGVFETGLVKAIFEELLESPFGQANHVDWELPFKRKFVDLSFYRREASDVIGVEVKWWNISGICDDLDKLNSLRQKGLLAHGAVLVLKARYKDGRADYLETHIDRELEMRGRFRKKASLLGSVCKIDSFGPGNREMEVEVALLELR